MMKVVRPAARRSSASSTCDFAEGIQVGGGLVHDEDRGVFEEGAGDGDALNLPAGEAHAAFADYGLIAVRQLADEIVRVGHGGGGVDLLAGGIAPAIEDILPDGAGEEHRLLRHDADGAAQRFERRLADVLPVDENAPLLHVVEARQDIHQRGFARAALPHQHHAPAGLHFQVDVAEGDHRVVAGIGEGDMLEGDSGRATGQQAFGAFARP